MSRLRAICRFSESDSARSESSFQINNSKEHARKFNNVTVIKLSNFLSVFVFTFTKVFRWSRSKTLNTYLYCVYLYLYYILDSSSLRASFLIITMFSLESLNVSQKKEKFLSMQVWIKFFLILAWTSPSSHVW